MPLFLREKSSLKGRWRLETVQDMRSSSSNPVSCSETSIKIYGSKEEIRARKSPETVDAPGFAPDASIPVTLYGPSDRIRTCGILLPKQARYHLRYTRLFGFYPAGHIHPKQPRNHRCRSPAFLRPCASCSVAGSPISIMDCRGQVNLRLPLRPRVKSKIPHPPPWNAWQPSVLLFFSIISL